SGEGEFSPGLAWRQRLASDQQERQSGAAGDGSARRRQEQRIETSDRDPGSRERAAKQHDAGNAEYEAEFFAGRGHVVARKLVVAAPGHQRNFTRSGSAS